MTGKRMGDPAEKPKVEKKERTVGLNLLFGMHNEIVPGYRIVKSENDFSYVYKVADPPVQDYFVGDRGDHFILYPIVRIRTGEKRKWLDEENTIRVEKIGRRK